MSNGACARVRIVAVDQVLEAGLRSAIEPDPHLELVPPDADHDVTVVVADVIDDATLELLRTVRAPDGSAAESVLVAAVLDAPGTLAAIRAGASAFLLRRDAGADRLRIAAHAALNGDCVLPPHLLDAVAKMAGELQSPAPAAPGALALSVREQEVLRRVADGHETADIAADLAYSVRTVTGIMHDITSRLHLRNRAHAVAYALRVGLI